MRTPALFLLLLAASLPGIAERPVTVDQLALQLASLQGKTDADAAQHIAEFQLTERLSWGRENDLERSLPGEKSREALQALADQSEFRDPPASEIPARPTPDIALQRQIMGLVVAYVGKTLPQLPNFIATRATKRFEDSPQRKADYVNKYEPLHPVASASAQVSYQDRREVVDPGAKSAKGQAPERGLSTWGEFGPILSTVLLDAARSKLGWLRWEPGAGGPVAVFAYSVPREASHYEVDYCCVQDSEGRTHTFHELEGYEGEMAVDPATGAILRLMMRAQIKAGEPVSRADLAVEYGPVEIGGKSYICPVRSISLSRAQSIGQEKVEMVQLSANGASGSAPLAPLVTGSTSNVTQQTLLNEVAFTGYHVFRAETRVVPEAGNGLPPLGSEPAAPVASVPEPAVATANSASAAPAGSSASPAAALAGGSSSSPATASTAATATAVTASAPASTSPVAGAAEAPEAEASEMVAKGIADVPDLPGAPQTPQPSSGFTLRTTTRLVEVALVATDKKGHPITDLKPDELEIYDSGREQKLKDFSQAGADVPMTAASAPPPQASADEPVSTNRPGAGTAGAIEQDSGNATVLLIDAAHVAFSDLTYARGEILRFLKTVPADEHVGLYILRNYGFQVLREPTGDHAGVAEALAKWMPSAQDLMHAQAEEQRNRQQFDTVHSLPDLASLNGNGEGGNDPEMYASGGMGSSAFAVFFSHPPDAQLRPMGDRPEDFALHLLVGVGRHLAAIPGHKTLVWIASDNVLADWSGGAIGEHEDNGNRFLDSASLRAREALNEAHASIYPLDVSQLEGGGISAAQGNANVGVVGLSSRDPALSGMGSNDNVNGNGRDTARMNADTHPIQPEFRALAEATGGRALRRAGDIAAELNSIVADGRAAYLLSFTPDTPADGKYHALKVKCLRKGVTLRYRNGYLYSEEPSTMRDRFREAVWDPRDESEIGLTAAAMNEAKGLAIRLNIAAADLEMAEQNGRWTDHLDVFLVVRDDSAQHAVIAGKRLGLALKPATYQRDMKDGLTVEERLPKLAPGALLRLIVIDENSRRMGAVTVGATVARGQKTRE